MRRKLSKMLLLPTRRPESEPGLRRRSTAAALPELHQLPPRPSATGDDGATASGCIVVDECSELCDRCAALDFPRILDWEAGQPRAWIPLSHVLQPLTTNCPFCLFFRAMLGPDAAAAGLGGKFTPYLRMRLAFERLAGLGEKHEIARCVLAEVVTRNRALPRGFIVKTDDVGERRRRLRGRIVPRLLDLSLLKGWMDHCREAHAATCCRPSEGAMVSGLRLIDCAERTVVCADGLVLDDGDDCGYVTLSYVWGDGTDDDDDDDDDDISDGSRLPDAIPAVFADAMTLTTSLGMRYLWIDRFCLAPLTADERRRQNRLMDDILSAASLTIIAASGTSRHQGLSGVSVPRDAQLSLKTDTGLYTTTLLRPDLDTAASPWGNRAWTLQEGLLARRRLVLGRGQAYFQCRALHCVESVALPLDLDPAVDLGRVFPDLLDPGRLCTHIGAFMERSLARVGDRLDAFGGLLRTWSRDGRRPVQHLLGLPLFHPEAFVNASAGVVSQTDRLAVALGWMPDRTALVGGSFPSWTWLSWTMDPGQGRGFNLGLVVGGVVQDGVCAPPGMEMSVGFVTGAVLSWEIDGDAVVRKSDAVSFLRLYTFCTHLCLRASSSSQDWTLEAPALPPHGQDQGGAATALVCRHDGWDPTRRLIRLGAVSFDHLGLRMGTDDAGLACGLLRGVGGEGEHLRLHMSEVDLY
ncbi:hypothetical protein L249_6248 [Ophiocordyceps polyrhachis-furcata BCC 54312]|uniref:Heterokaryon incompatibility domain-containing protein n=1 Tax=Ophiocordyceps polyrhachis-furcata BCC 54312 TaxID=1330021 RepID=A0A367L1A1_9HYPO|nr:hypothetical protein L249_6248 [Ophiocordyceps polyrhachis-furcata BCC 54312]